MARRIHIAPSVTLAALSFAPCAHAAIFDANPSNYQSLVSSLSPGDTLRLASGTYTQGLALTGKSGTSAQPIIVSGPDDQSAVFTSRDCCNTVQLEGTSYVRMLNLTLDAGTRNGSSAVDSRGNSHHITLENLTIIGHGGSAQTAGISANGRSSNWTIRHNTIVATAIGIQIDSADGADPFAAGQIDHNVLVDTAGNALYIEPQTNARVYGNTFYRNSGKTSAVNQLAVRANTFVNSAEDAAGSASTQQRVRIAAVTAAAATPTVTLNASPGNVAVGGTTTLNWSSTDAAGCSASGGWNGTKNPSGSETVGPIQSTTSFQLTCLGSGGNAGAMTQVTVGGSSPPPPNDPDPTPPSDPDPTPPSDNPTPPPPGSTPPPPPPSGSTPPPSSPSPPGMNDMRSGGGGSLSLAAVTYLALIAAFRVFRRRRKVV